MDRGGDARNCLTDDKINKVVLQKKIADGSVRIIGSMIVFLVSHCVCRISWKSSIPSFFSRIVSAFFIAEESLV